MSVPDEHQAATLIFFDMSTGLHGETVWAQLVSLTGRFFFLLSDFDWKSIGWGE